MPEDPVAKLYRYIHILEQTNDELLNIVKQCVSVLEELTPSVPDPSGWKDMLMKFQLVIRAGERVTLQKTLH